MSARPYYQSEERQQRLLEEAKSWLYTPFAENCAVKGPQGGVSCERFQVALHTATGAAPASLAASLPPLPVEIVRCWHEHHSESRVLSWLERPEIRARMRKVDEAEQPMIGDVVVVRVQKTLHHLGVWCGAWVYHVAIPAGVVRHSVHDPELRKMIRCTYRIFEG